METCPSSHVIGPAKREPVRTPESTRSEGEAGMLTGTSSQCHSPCGAQTGAAAGLRGHLPVMATWFGTREFPSEGHLLSCYQTLTEATPMTEGCEMILEHETPIMSRRRMEKRSSGGGGAQEYSLIKRKGFYGVRLPGQCEEEVLTAGSLSSPETDSGTVRGAAGFCCHLDSALQRTLN